MIRRLSVHHADGHVGILERDAAGRFAFTYAEAWLASPARFAISWSLPLQPEPHTEVAHRFFSNLLPEADLRRMLCSRLGISVDNDFELLAAIGGECAGALTLTPEDAPAPGTQAPEYRPLTREELEALAASQVLPAVDGQKGLRLSLAGAQDKLPVRLVGSDIYLPIGNAPSTHILKFPNRRYKHLPANEVLVLLVAEELGLPTARAALWPLRREGMCVVERYDRVVDGAGNTQRLHQEDLCQALGLPHVAKYEKEGGPNFQACFETVRKASIQPLVDGRSLLRWLAFNVAVFNADGHAKNVSLLYTPAGPRLAPFYDLVCTRAYDALSTELAMSVSGEANPTQVRRTHWEALAHDLGLGTRFALDLVRDVAERVPNALKVARAAFVERYSDSPALQLIAPKVSKQARRMALLLD